MKWKKELNFLHNLHKYAICINMQIKTIFKLISVNYQVNYQVTNIN